MTSRHQPSEVFTGKFLPLRRNRRRRFLGIIRFLGGSSQITAGGLVGWSEGLLAGWFEGQTRQSTDGAMASLAPLRAVRGRSAEGRGGFGLLSLAERSAVFECKSVTLKPHTISKAYICLEVSRPSFKSPYIVAFLLNTRLENSLLHRILQRPPRPGSACSSSCVSNRPKRPSVPLQHFSITHNRALDPSLASSTHPEP